MPFSAALRHPLFQPSRALSQCSPVCRRKLSMSRSSRVMHQQLVYDIVAPTPARRHGRQVSRVARYLRRGGAGSNRKTAQMVQSAGAKCLITCYTSLGASSGDLNSFRQSREVAAKLSRTQTNLTAIRGINLRQSRHRETHFFNTLHL